MTRRRRTASQRLATMDVQAAKIPPHVLLRFVCLFIYLSIYYLRGGGGGGEGAEEVRPNGPSSSGLASVPIWINCVSQINEKRFFFFLSFFWSLLLLPPLVYIFIMLLSFVIDATFSVASDCQRCIDKREREREALELIPLCFTVVVIQRLASRARGSAYAKIKKKKRGGKKEATWKDTVGR